MYQKYDFLKKQKKIKNLFFTPWYIMEIFLVACFYCIWLLFLLQFYYKAKCIGANTCFEGKEARVPSHWVSEHL